MHRESDRTPRLPPPSRGPVSANKIREFLWEPSIAPDVRCSRLQMGNPSQGQRPGDHAGPAPGPHAGGSWRPGSDGRRAAAPVLLRQLPYGACPHEPHKPGSFRLGENMRTVSSVVIFLLNLCPGYPASTLSGIWILNRAKSSFGMNAPEQVVVRMERTGSRLTAFRITTDLDGQHLDYREYRLDGKQQSSMDAARSTLAGFVFPIETAGGTRIDERWQISRAGRLIIHRSITDGARTVHQRLVFDLCVRDLE